MMNVNQTIADFSRITSEGQRFKNYSSFHIYLGPRFSYEFWQQLMCHIMIGVFSIMILKKENMFSSWHIAVSQLCAQHPSNWIVSLGESVQMCSLCTWRSRRRHRWWWLPNRHSASSLPSGPGPARPELSLRESRQNTKCFHCSWKELMLWIQSDNSLKYVTAFEYREYVLIRKDYWEKKEHTCERKMHYGALW